MGRKKKQQVEQSEPRLKEETKHGIVAVVFFALAIFFVLAQFEYAGLAGRQTFKVLDYLFGAGFLLVPTVCFILGVSFLKSIKPNFVAHRLIGGLILFVSLLGIVAITFNSETGGLVGSLVSSPLLKFFDFYISLVFLGALALISLLVMFDARLMIPTFSFRRNKQIEELEVEPTIITPPEPEEDEEVVVETPKNKPKKESIEEEETSLFGKLGLLGKKGIHQDFTPPPLSLLSKDSGKPGVGDIKANSNIIKRTLMNFGINVEMDEISIGPSVTRYALKPAEGVKLSRIVSLQNDLALALAAHPLRIEAPIPGKSLVGIEIPNSVKTTVGLASLLSSKDFSDSAHPLLLSLGRGISGLPHFSNLAKAPHLLIAGATGSGKSVTIHTLITSLLYRNPPDRLRFIMIDPKRVELTLYNKIPHQLTPVITDPKKAIAALRWAAKEMDRRYNILETETVRDIQSYHKNVLEPALKKKDEENDIEAMPYIVIIIDELADIMSTYPRELEAAIVRLAQMSRAVGIHLILSTQRPSVEVITGLIKANIPSRIALQVASQIDSRTIIDMAGAEKLLGAGDMLYLSSDMSKPVRLQSAFVSEDEVKKVVDFLAKQYEDEPPSVIDLGNNENQGGIFSASIEDGDDDDDMYELAREAVIEAGKASASYLQRKLKVGYARAARLLDMLEERGVIGPGEGAKPRDVYVKPGNNGEDEV